MTTAMFIRPCAARTPAATSVVSPGIGTPDDSSATIRKSSAGPWWTISWSRKCDTAAASLGRAGTGDRVGHQDRVDELAGAQVVAAPVALAVEPVLLVERDRRLVVREDVELELRDPDLARPADRRVEERGADAPPPVALGDHQAEVRDVEARRVRVAGEREPADDALGRLGDDDRGVAGAADRPDVAPLLARAPPAAGRDQPASRLRADVG